MCCSISQACCRPAHHDGPQPTFRGNLAVNALAPFLLTRLLLPALERPGTARVVTVSSRLHLPGSRGKPVGFDNAKWSPRRAEPGAWLLRGLVKCGPCGVGTSCHKMRGRSAGSGPGRAD